MASPACLGCVYMSTTHPSHRCKYCRGELHVQPKPKPCVWCGIDTKRATGCCADCRSYEAHHQAVKESLAHPFECSWCGVGTHSHARACPECQEKAA